MNLHEIMNKIKIAVIIIISSDFRNKGKPTANCFYSPLTSYPFGAQVATLSPSKKDANRRWLTYFQWVLALNPGIFLLALHRCFMI
jgi:hypothetical protein